MSFLGADTDELRNAAQECQQGKETTDEVITYLRILIALLKAASFFSGGASAAYAEYLETVVVPWLQKISAALGLFAQVLGANAEAQDQASQGETVDFGALPSYTSQLSGDSSVQPFSGSVLGSGANAGAAFGAITSAASDPAVSSTATPTTVTVTSPDGTVTTVGPGADSGAGGAATVTTTPVTTPISASTPTDSVIPRDGIGHDANLRVGDGTWVPAGPHHGAGAGGGGGSFAPAGTGGGSGGGSGLGVGSVDGGAGGTHDASFSDAGPSAVHSSAGTGLGTPGADALTGTGNLGGDPVALSDGGNGTSYGAAGAIAGGAGALGLAGAALAPRMGGGTVTGGADPEIDRLGAANGVGSRGSDVTSLQQRLTDAGYDTRGVDGAWGPNTQAAYEQYRADHPLPVQTGTGYTSPSGYDYNQIRGVRNNPNVTPEFLRQMEGVAQRVGAKPEELMGVMSLESMGTFRPSVANPGTHATGLIQFMPQTARGLGTSISELSRMTPSEQLPWVEKYLSQPQYRGRVGTLEGLYSAVLPGHIMGPDEVMFRPGTAAYNANRWLDTDGRNGISVQEAVQQVRARMGQGAR